MSIRPNDGSCPLTPTSTPIFRAFCVPLFGGEFVLSCVLFVIFFRNVVWDFAANAGGIYSGSCASYAPVVLPVLPPLPEPEEAYRGTFAYDIRARDRLRALTVVTLRDAGC